MAAKRRKSSTARQPAKPARPARPARAAKPAKTVDEGAEKPGMPVEVALALATLVLLVAALVLLEVEKGVHYGTGLFAGQYAGSSS